MPDPNESADQVADLQAQLDPTRSECIRPIIMEHLHRAMRAKSNTDKYHEYHALCVACLSYIEDDELKQEIIKDLYRPDTNLSNDFIRNYKAEMQSGVPNYLILENEYSRLIPRIVEVWLKVQKALIEQDLIPWTLTYPEKILEGSLIDEIITDIQMQKFRRAAPIHEAERAAMGAPAANPMLLPTQKHYTDDGEVTPMTLGEHENEEEGEEQPEEEETYTKADIEKARDEEVLKSSKAMLNLAREIMTEAEEEDSVPEEGNEPDPPHAGERIAEDELSRMSSFDPEPEKPTEEENREYTDEEIDRGARAMKQLLQEKMNHAREYGHPREDRQI